MLCVYNEAKQLAGRKRKTVATREIGSASLKIRHVCLAHPFPVHRSAHFYFTPFLNSSDKSKKLLWLNYSRL